MSDDVVNNESVASQNDATEAFDARSEAERQRDEYIDALQRLQADFENYRRRVLRSSEDAGARAAGDIVAKLLPVLDSFDYYLMSGWMYSNALSASEAYPTVFPVGHVFPAGSTIKINIRDLSEAANPLQLAFVGEKLFGVRHD